MAEEASVLPEGQRNLLRSAVKRIRSIADDLVAEYRHTSRLRQASDKDLYNNPRPRPATQRQCFFDLYSGYLPRKTFGAPKHFQRHPQASSPIQRIGELRQSQPK